MSLNRICPSLAIGFYIRNMDEFFRFKAQILEMKKMDDCIFSVFDSYEDSAQAKMERRLAKMKSLDVEELSQKKVSQEESKSGSGKAERATESDQQTLKSETINR